MVRARISRMKLTRWLVERLDEGNIPGLEWMKRRNGLWRLPWMHQGRRDWSDQANQVCTMWEKYRGRTGKTSKAAKATFRNALRSVIKRHEVIKVREMTTSRSPFIMYAFTDLDLVREPDMVVAAHETVAVTDVMMDDVSSSDGESDAEADLDAQIPTTVFEVAMQPAVPAKHYKGRRTDTFFKANRFRAPALPPARSLRVRPDDGNDRTFLRDLDPARRQEVTSDVSGSGSDSTSGSESSFSPVRSVDDDWEEEMRLIEPDVACTTEIRTDPETPLSSSPDLDFQDFYPPAAQTGGVLMREYTDVNDL